MRRESATVYADQFEYLADCFELIRLRCDAYALRTDAMETERMSRYSERHGRGSDRGHLLEIYYDLDRSIARKEDLIVRRKKDTEKSGARFAIDTFSQNYSLGRDEMKIILVLLYNESAGRNQTRYTTGNDILNLIYPTSVEALKASRFFSAGASLIGKALVRCLPDEDGANFLRANYEVTEKTLREVLGGRSGEYNSVLETLPEGPFQIREPAFDLNRVVLGDQVRAVLEDVLWQAREGQMLFQQWGMDRLLEKGRGLVVLFSGLPGTGKTMTAEGMAGALKRKLLVVDYSQLESKWIGETEKNIVQIFRAASDARSVLLLDEADAILAGRLDGGHYNDRAYNRQVSLLLQELEHFDGLCILTTNRSTSLDEGLARRISTTVTFDVPGPPEREEIWRRLISPRVPLSVDVDIPALAMRFQLTGGHIKNIVVSALRTAARRGGEEARVTQRDFMAAGEREKAAFRSESRRIGFGKMEGLSYS
jgi:hypothetical protein